MISLRSFLIQRKNYSTSHHKGKVTEHVPKEVKMVSSRMLIIGPVDCQIKQILITPAV